MNDTTLALLNTLVELKKISPEVSEAVNIESLQSNLPLEEILKKKNLVSDADITLAKSKIFDIPYISLNTKAFSPEVSSLITEPIARRYNLVPFKYDESTNTLSIAFDNPFETQLIDFLKQKTGKNITAYIATRNEILNAIDAVYSQHLGEDVSAALREQVQDAQAGIKAKKMEQVIREAPIAQIVSSLLEQGVKLRASDIHIEPRDGDTRIRYRIDGILQERLILPHRLHDAVVSRIKILADLKIDEKRVPQDGRFNYSYTTSNIDLRVSTLPTVYGEKVVLRLLRKTGGVPDLKELGLEGLALKNLDISITRPHGIILVTGPTGSGKTTTLYSVLNRLNKTSVNIMTLEDPVEYVISGINQVQINPQAGLTFANGLRSFLRQDPNIMLVGEIRDRETTDLAIQAALTGHLVFSTIHTNNAAGAVPRLLDMGAEPFLVASALNAVVGQRIVRQVCKTCRKSYTPDLPVAEAIHTVLQGLIPESEEITLYRGTGKENGELCQTCQGTMYYGRIGIFEVFPVSEVISKQILTRSSMRDIEKQAVTEGMITMKQDGYLKALRGITTVEEVLRVAEE